MDNVGGNIPSSSFSNLYSEENLSIPWSFCGNVILVKYCITLLSCSGVVGLTSTNTLYSYFVGLTSFPKLSV